MTAKKKKRASLVTMLLLKFPSGNAVTCVEIIGWLIAGYFCKMRMPRLSSFLCHRVPRAAWRLRFRKAGYGFLRNASPTEFLYLRRDDSCSGNGFGIRGEKRDDRSNCAVMFLATKWTIARKFFSSSNYQFQKCTYVSPRNFDAWKEALLPIWFDWQRGSRRPRRSITELISESRNQGVRFNGRRHDTESCCRSIFNLQFCDKTVDTVERRVRGSEGPDRRSKGAFESFVKIETTRRNASPETMKPRGRAWLVRALS